MTRNVNEILTDALKCIVAEINSEEVISALKKILIDREQNQSNQGRWEPAMGEKYGYIDDFGEWEFSEWVADRADTYRYAIGNCYPLDQKERAIWEQVTRRKYDQALRDAADWASGDYWECSFDNYQKKICALSYDVDWVSGKPRFTTEESAVKAHSCILGDDAERYFNSY